MTVRKYSKYSAFYDSLNDDKAAFDLHEQQFYDAFSHVKNNTLKDKKQFEGKVIEIASSNSDPKTSSASSGTNSKKVVFYKIRTTEIHDNILEEDQKIVDPFLKKQFSSMHPNVPFVPSDGQNIVKFSKEDTVTCKYTSAGPNNNGLQRGLQMTDEVLSRGSGNYSYSQPAASSAFNNFGTPPQTLGQIEGVLGEGDLKWKDVIIQGSVWPEHPIRTNMKVKPNKHIRERYLPAAEKVFANDPKGFRLLATAMAIKEGYYPDTRAYKYNNPGNIGNTDSGKNKGMPTLEDGIRLQRSYIARVASGNHKYYKLNKPRFIKPYYSKEIARNRKSYKKSPYLPGYKFVYTGQLDQYVKIYATGARSGNGYLSLIISYFRQNGIIINETSKVQDVILMN